MNGIKGVKEWYASMDLDNAVAIKYMLWFLIGADVLGLYYFMNQETIGGFFFIILIIALAIIIVKENELNDKQKPSKRKSKTKKSGFNQFKLNKKDYQIDMPRNLFNDSF